MNASTRRTARGASAPTPLPTRYLTPEDLVTMFGLPSIETVYTWRRKHIGPPGFRVGKHLRYDPTAVATWVTAQTALEDAA
ncbi:DNA-binding protein [Streptomyces albus]|uniref:DNA-binding protein n=1 Tax=Streptomyces albus (strain ATCC 21838 / DSM 41398 / FERM P-419 / JCM 4703 / NBRC 107858) TaxID=1081613 RepID=A0A0B5ERS0_STRA4|nr:DNA-binding protein [Streptomyces albus]AOU76307.1 DNA-binding protein [Streptomyces albus]AYN32093.1 DNA-binding protein [Streptomyces albus]